MISPSLKKKNRAFFALEFLEQRYLRHLLQELNQLINLKSVVLVHDGFYQGVSALEGLKLYIFSACSFFSLTHLTGGVACFSSRPENFVAVRLLNTGLRKLCC